MAARPHQTTKLEQVFGGVQIDALNFFDMSMLEFPRHIRLLIHRLKYEIEFADVTLVKDAKTIFERSTMVTHVVTEIRTEVERLLD